MAEYLSPFPKTVAIVINQNLYELTPWKVGCGTLSMHFLHGSPRPATLLARPEAHSLPI